jgi:hypothetical protein
MVGMEDPEERLWFFWVPFVRVVFFKFLMADAASTYSRQTFPPTGVESGVIAR